MDTYRLGKSLRKKGFEADGLAGTLAGVAAQANAVLAGWVASGAIVDVEAAGPKLTDPRDWVCFLPEGVARIPCGGTHLRSLTEVSRISVELAHDGVAELVMTTAVTR